MSDKTTATTRVALELGLSGRIIMTDPSRFHRTIDRNCFTVEVGMRNAWPVSSGLVRRFHEWCPPHGGADTHQDEVVERWWFPDARSREEVEEYVSAEIEAGKTQVNA